MTIEEIILKIVIPFLGGGSLGWVGRWLWEKRKVILEHKLRVIEEHTKSLHRYVEQHYMPVCNYAERLAISLSRLSQRGTTQASTDELYDSFFRLARWSYAQYKWLQTIGGVLMLRNRIGEIVLSELQAKITTTFFAPDKYLTMRDLHELNQFLDCNEQAYRFLSEFQRKLLNERLAGIYANYLRWLDQVDISQLVKELSSYDKLFMYEINKTYEPWYGVEPTKPKVDFTVITEMLKEVEADDAKKHLKRI